MKKTINLRHIIIQLLAILVLPSCNSDSKTNKEKEPIIKACDNMMQLFSEHKISESIEILKSNTLVIEPHLCDSLKVTVKHQFDRMNYNYGEIIDWEFAREYSYDDLISKRIYILNFEKQFLKFDFTLYKGSSGWKITQFNADNELYDLIY